MSMDFDGVNDIINNGTGTSMDNLITMSYCSWFFSDANPENNIGYILCRTSGSTLGEILSRQTGTGSADRNIVFFSRYSTFGGWNSPAGSILNLKWYFVAVTYDGGSSSNNPTIYINGNSVAVNESTTPSGTYPNDSAYSTYIGNRPADTARTFNGKIAHVQMFNRVISQGEVKQIMFFPGSIRNGLVGYWPLLGSASPETDLSGNKNNGTVTGAIKGTTEPPINGMFTIPRPELMRSF